MSSNNNTPLRSIRNPESWIGKRIPHNYDIHTMPIDYDQCDCCGHWFKADDLHNIMYPVCDADWLLFKALYIEEAQGFCPTCLTLIEREAEKIDPDWFDKHLAGLDAQLDRRANKPSPIPTTKPEAFAALVTAFKDELTPAERFDLEAARDAWLSEFAANERGWAWQLFWRSVPGFKSYEREFILRTRNEAQTLHDAARRLDACHLAEGSVRLAVRACELDDLADALGGKGM